MTWQTIKLGCYHLADTGLEVHGTPTLRQAEEAGRWLLDFEARNQRYIGQWVNDLMERYPDTYDQALPDPKVFDPDTLKEWGRVVRSIHRWVPSVSFSAHQSVAALDPVHQQRILRKAKDERLTLQEVRREVQKVKRRPVQAGQAETMWTVEVTVRISLEAATAYAAEQAAWATVKTAISAIGHAHVIASHSGDRSSGPRMVRSRKAG